jgi:hypothetical protein
MSQGYTVLPSSRTRNPNVNLADPIHRRFSVARSDSATMPTDWERNESVLVVPWVIDTRSSGVRRPFTTARAPTEGLFVPLRLQLMAFPDPHGSCTTAIFDNAFLASGRFPRPLKTS